MCGVAPGGSGAVVRRRGVQTSGGCGLVEATVLWARQVGTSPAGCTRWQTAVVIRQVIVLLEILFYFFFHLGC